MDKLGLVGDQGEGLVLKAGRGKYSLICSNTMYNDGHTGRMVLQKRMNFRKNSKRGDVIFNPKIYIADFGDFEQFFEHDIETKE